MELRELTDNLQEAITSTFRALKTKEVKIMIDMLLLPKRRTQEYYNGKDDSELTYKIYVACVATVYKGNIIKNLIMDCQSYTKYRPNETTGGIFVSWRRKEELPTGA